MDFNKNNPWWKPALIFYIRATTWIAFPILLGLFVGKKVDAYLESTPIGFFVCIAIAFSISIWGIWREIKRYQHNLEK